MLGMRPYAQSDVVAGVFLVHIDCAVSVETAKPRKAVDHSMKPLSIRKTDEDGEGDKSAQDVDVGFVLDPYESLGCRKRDSVVEHPARKAEYNRGERIIIMSLRGH